MFVNIEVSRQKSKLVFVIVFISKGNMMVFFLNLIFASIYVCMCIHICMCVYVGDGNVHISIQIILPVFNDTVIKNKTKP